MRKQKEKKSHRITLTYANGVTRSVMVKASSREVAENRALKRNRGATGVKRDA